MKRATTQPQDDWDIYDAAFGGRSTVEADDALQATPWHWLALVLLVGAIVGVVVFGLRGTR